jgi:hypothetical protein
MYVADATTEEAHMADATAVAAAWELVNDDEMEVEDGDETEVEDNDKNDDEDVEGDAELHAEEKAIRTASALWEEAVARAAVELEKHCRAEELIAVGCGAHIG